MKTFLVLSLLLIVGCEKNFETPNLQNAFGTKDFSICIQDNFKNYKYNFKFIAGNKVKVEVLHNTYLCKPGFDYFKETYEANYSFNPSTEEVTETKTTKSYTILEANELDLKNDDGFCGITDWTIDEPRDVEGLNCDGNVFNSGEINRYKGFYDNEYFYINNIPYILVR